MSCGQRHNEDLCPGQILQESRVEAVGVLLHAEGAGAGT